MRARRSGIAVRVGALCALVLVLGAPPLTAQAGGTRGQARRPVSEMESRLLRDASLAEVRGDHAGAERILRELLDSVPTSDGALFAIERALRQQDRAADVLPLLDRLLDLEPGASNVRTMKLRVLVDVDSLETLDQQALAWIRAEPGSPGPYREMALVYERAFGQARAVEFLREGRSSLGDPTAFTLELGDLLLRAGEFDAAVEEWSSAIGEEGRQTNAVMRRIAQLGRFEEVGTLLLRALEKQPVTPARRVAALQVALQLALTEDALRLARDVAPRLAESDRRGVLQEVARRGEELRAHALSLWAYEALLAIAPSEQELRSLHGLVAGSALALGDTARALAARANLAESLPRGSAERRRVLSETLTLQVERMEPGRAAEAIADFREEFPDAPELDPLVSRVAFSLRVRGDTETAGALLEDVRGPQSALERGYLHLERGEMDAGTAALREAIELLPPARATDVVQLVGLLGRLTPEGASALAAAAARAHRGAPAEAVDALALAIPGTAEADRAPLLAHAARLADAGGLLERAAELRAHLLETYRSSTEAAEAAFHLARWNVQAGRTAEAIRLLEALIVERPGSPVVPDARRELGRIRPGGGA